MPTSDDHGHRGKDHRAISTVTATKAAQVKGSAIPKQKKMPPGQGSFQHYYFKMFLMSLYFIADGAKCLVLIKF